MKTPIKYFLVLVAIIGVFFVFKGSIKIFYTPKHRMEKRCSELCKVGVFKLGMTYNDVYSELKNETKFIYTSWFNSDFFKEHDEIYLLTEDDKIYETEWIDKNHQEIKFLGVDCVHVGILCLNDVEFYFLTDSLVAVSFKCNYRYKYPNGNDILNHYIELYGNGNGSISKEVVREPKEEKFTIETEHRRWYNQYNQLVYHRESTFKDSFCNNLVPASWDERYILSNHEYDEVCNTLERAKREFRDIIKSNRQKRKSRLEIERKKSLNSL